MGPVGDFLDIGNVFFVGKFQSLFKQLTSLKLTFSSIFAPQNGWLEDEHVGVGWSNFMFNQGRNSPMVQPVVYDQLEILPSYVGII